MHLVVCAIWSYNDKVIKLYSIYSLFYFPILKELMDIISTIGIAIITAGLTLVFALWQFRSKRMVELKIEKYTRVIETLYYINKANDAFYDDFLLQTCSFDEYSEEEIPKKLEKKEVDYWNKLINDSKEEIDKIVNTSSFIISPEGLQALKHLQRNYGKSSYPEEEVYEIYERDVKLAKACLSKLLVIARQDIQPHPCKCCESVQSVFFWICNEFLSHPIKSSTKLIMDLWQKLRPSKTTLE